jgi:enhancing lycopene biosynthesis protein 2
MKCLVLLAGCGLGDGSQIEEVILTYLTLDKYKIEYQPIAINKDTPCFNHLTEEKEGQRNILIESARIGRGRIKNLTDIDLDEYKALIIPGGIGLIRNYRNSEEIHKLVNDFIDKGKPIAGMCSALVLFQKIISSDILKMERDFTDSTNYCYDEQFNVYYTLAFRRSQNLNEILHGIDSMINALINIYNLNLPYNELNITYIIN